MKKNKLIAEKDKEIDQLIKIIHEADKQMAVLKLKNKSSLANNLCPDHRDKQEGKSCLACEIERKDKEIALLTRIEQEQRKKKEWYQEEHAKGMKEVAQLKEELEKMNEDNNYSTPFINYDYSYRK